jgi:hypothetical protein
LRILDPDEDFDRMARGNGGLETSGSLLKPPSATSTPLSGVTQAEQQATGCLKTSH